MNYVKTVHFIKISRHLFYSAKTIFFLKMQLTKQSDKKKIVNLCLIIWLFNPPSYTSNTFDHTYVYLILLNLILQINTWSSGNSTQNSEYQIEINRCPICFTQSNKSWVQIQLVKKEKWQGQAIELEKLLWVKK